MQLAVRNLLRIKAADLEIEPGQVALVAGLNDQGKSSLIQCAGAVVTGNPFMRTITNKNKAGALVREGTKSGRVAYGNGAVKVQLKYPECEREEKGDLMDDANPVVVGTVQLMSLKPDERMRMMTDVLAAWAKHVDLIQFLKGHGITKSSDKLWARIEEEGWDVVHDHVKESGKKLKGVWEHIAQTRWGSSKGEDWIPDDFDYDVAVNYPKVVETRQQILEAAIANQAVSRERIEALQATVKAGQDVIELLEKAPGQMTALEEELAGYVREADAFPLDPSCQRKLKCPHCNKDVVLDKRKLETAQLEVPPPAIDGDALEQQRMDWGKWDGQAHNCRDRITELQNNILRWEQALDAGEKAKAELAKVEEQEGAAEDLEQARADLAEAETELREFQRMQEAAAQHKKIVQNQILVEALGPAGARMIPITKALELLNSKLTVIVAHMAPFPEVKIEDDMSMTVGGRPYALESESNQLRANVALQCALAKDYVPTPLLVLDRLDVLVGGARTGVLKALKSTGVPALVTMSAKSQEAVPPIEKAKLGRRYWMEDGELKPFVT